MNHKHTAMTVKIIAVYDNLLQQTVPLKAAVTLASIHSWCFLALP